MTDGPTEISAEALAACSTAAIYREFAEMVNVPAEFGPMLRGVLFRRKGWRVCAKLVLHGHTRLVIPAWRVGCTEYIEHIFEATVKGNFYVPALAEMASYADACATDEREKWETVPAGVKRDLICFLMEYNAQLCPPAGAPIAAALRAAAEAKKALMDNPPSDYRKLVASIKTLMGMSVKNQKDVEGCRRRLQVTGPLAPLVTLDPNKSATLSTIYEQGDCFDKVADFNKWPKLLYYRVSRRFNVPVRRDETRALTPQELVVLRASELFNEVEDMDERISLWDGNKELTQLHDAVLRMVVLVKAVGEWVVSDANTRRTVPPDVQATLGSLSTAGSKLRGRFDKVRAQLGEFIKYLHAGATKPGAAPAHRAVAKQARPNSAFAPSEVTMRAFEEKWNRAAQGTGAASRISELLSTLVQGDVDGLVVLLRLAHLASLRLSPVVASGDGAAPALLAYARPVCCVCRAPFWDTDVQQPASSKMEVGDGDIPGFESHRDHARRSFAGTSRCCLRGYSTADGVAVKGGEEHVYCADCCAHVRSVTFLREYYRLSTDELVGSLAQRSSDGDDGSSGALRARLAWGAEAMVSRDEDRVSSLQCDRHGPVIGDSSTLLFFRTPFVSDTVAENFDATRVADTAYLAWNYRTEDLGAELGKAGRPSAAPGEQCRATERFAEYCFDGNDAEFPLASSECSPDPDGRLVRLRALGATQASAVQTYGAPLTVSPAASEFPITAATLDKVVDLYGNSEPGVRDGPDWQMLQEAFRWLHSGPRAIARQKQVLDDLRAQTRNFVYTLSALCELQTYEVVDPSSLLHELVDVCCDAMVKNDRPGAVARELVYSAVFGMVLANGTAANAAAAAPAELVDDEEDSDDGDYEPSEDDEEEDERDVVLEDSDSSDDDDDAGVKAPEVDKRDIVQGKRTVARTDVSNERAEESGPFNYIPSFDFVVGEGSTTSPMGHLLARLLPLACKVRIIETRQDESPNLCLVPAYAAWERDLAAAKLAKKRREREAPAPVEKKIRLAVPAAAAALSLLPKNDVLRVVVAKAVGEPGGAYVQTLLVSLGTLLMRFYWVLANNKNPAKATNSDGWLAMNAVFELDVAPFGSIKGVYVRALSAHFPGDPDGATVFAGYARAAYNKAATVSRKPSEPPLSDIVIDDADGEHPLVSGESVAAWFNNFSAHSVKF